MTDLRQAVESCVEKVYDETHNLGQATDAILAIIDAAVTKAKRKERSVVRSSIRKQLKAKGFDPKIVGYTRPPGMRKSKGDDEMSEIEVCINQLQNKGGSKMSNKKDLHRRSVETLGLSSHGDKATIAQIADLIHKHQEEQPYEHNVLLRIKDLVKDIV